MVDNKEILAAVSVAIILSVASLSVSLYVLTTRVATSTSNTGPSETLTSGRSSNTESVFQSSSSASSSTYESRLVGSFNASCCIEGVGYDPLNNRIYAGITTASPKSYNSSLLVIDGSRNRVIGTVQTGLAPEGIVFDNDNGLLYVANSGSHTIVALDPTTNQVKQNLSIGNPQIGYPYLLGYNPWNKEIYVTTGSSVLMLNTTSGKVVTTLNVGNITGMGTPCSLVYNSATHDMYVAGAGELVLIISGSTNQIKGQVLFSQGAYGLAFDSIRSRLYVEGTEVVHNKRGFASQIGIVYEVDGLTNQIISNFTVGGYPDAIGFNPSNGDLYITNTTAYGVTVVSTSTNTVVSNMTWLGNEGQGIGYSGVVEESFFVFNPSNQEMYLATADGSFLLFS